MKDSNRLIWNWFFTGLILFSFLFSFAALAQEKQSVYEFVIEKSGVSFEEAAKRIENGIAESSFQLLSAIDQAAPEGCSFRTRVFALVSPEITSKLIEINPTTAPFASVMRINLFEDENGVNVSIVNPKSVFRTVLVDDQRALVVANEAYQLLRSMIEKAFQQSISRRAYGQVRKKGYIGRTMGVMAGGPFDKKINTLLTRKGISVHQAVEKLSEAFETNTGKWQLGVKYQYRNPQFGFAVMGVSGSKMEQKSFDIVKAGSDKKRKGLKCPGIAHAGAYPIELLIRRTDNGVTVEVIDVMYRMKLYFEDAGKWAFAKNMGMPGSIQDEIKDVVTRAFAQ